VCPGAVTPSGCSGWSSASFSITVYGSHGQELAGDSTSATASG
jgi:hypothetical protein